MTQIYRRVCVLRAQGRGGDAAQLYAGKFSEALDVIEQFAGAGPDTEARLQSLLAAEDERVASASVVAELVTPLIADRLREIFPGTSSPSAPRNESVEKPAASSPASPAPGSAPSIADLIEGMLAQERAAPRDAQRAS